MTTTYQTILGAHDVEIPAHLIAEAEVPVLAGLQFQGDVAIVPTRPGKTAAQLVPPAGVPVVRGEAGGHTHLLVADGPVLWNPAQTGGLALGLVVVPDGAVAYLLHPEHGAMGMAPGSYILRRQREQADVIRVVAD
jgi:hypothetical protein